MTEIQILQGKHTCGRKMDFRITSTEKDDKTPRPFYIIYGICKKCNIVVVSGLFMDKKPIIDVDFIIDYSLQIKENELKRKGELFK